MQKLRKTKLQESSVLDCSFVEFRWVKFGYAYMTHFSIREKPAWSETILSRELIENFGAISETDRLVAFSSIEASSPCDASEEPDLLPGKRLIPIRRTNPDSVFILDPSRVSVG